MCRPGGACDRPFFFAGEILWSWLSAIQLATGSAIPSSTGCLHPDRVTFFKLPTRTTSGFQDDDSDGWDEDEDETGFASWPAA